MKIYNTLPFIALIFLVLSNTNLAQSFQGPDSGSIPSGVIQSTDAFMKTSVLTEPKEMIGNEETDGYKCPDLFMNLGTQKLEGSNYIQGIDQNINLKKINSNSKLIKSFSGPGMSNSIPPDPYTAVGPNYIITTVNTTFAIYDKDGNNIKNVDATKWLSSSVPDPGVVTDPKVIYDHFNKRFVLVWLTVNTAAFNHIGQYLSLMILLL
jgi:hypothetical protein